jgi:hypothetical protein
MERTLKKVDRDLCRDPDMIERLMHQHCVCAVMASPRRVRTWLPPARIFAMRKITESTSWYVRFRGNELPMPAAAKPSAAIQISAPLSLHLHDLAHGHHVRVEMRHDPERAADHEKHDQKAERQSQYVVGVVGPGGDLKEEHQMDAHLRDRQHYGDGNARLPDQFGARDKERHRGEQDRKA